MVFTTQHKTALSNKYLVGLLLFWVGVHGFANPVHDTTIYVAPNTPVVGLEYFEKSPTQLTILYIIQNTIFVSNQNLAVVYINNKQNPAQVALMHLKNKPETPNNNTSKATFTTTNFPKFPFSPIQNKNVVAVAAGGATILLPSFVAKDKVTIAQSSFLQSITNTTSIKITITFFSLQNSYLFLLQQIHQNKAPPVC